MSINVHVLYHYSVLANLAMRNKIEDDVHTLKKYNANVEANIIKLVFSY